MIPESEDNVDGENEEEKARERKERKELKGALKKWKSKRRRCIKDWVEGSTDDTISDLSSVEFGVGMDLYTHAASLENVNTLSCAFRDVKVALKILQKSLPVTDYEKIIGGTKNVILKHIKICCNIVCWLSYAYKDLRLESSCNIWTEKNNNKRYHTGRLKELAHFKLANTLLQSILGHRSQLDYTKERDSIPLYLGAKVCQDQSLCEYLRQLFEESPDDNREEKKEKEELRTYV